MATWTWGWGREGEGGLNCESSIDKDTLRRAKQTARRTCWIAQEASLEFCGDRGGGMGDKEAGTIGRGYMYARS